MMRSRTSAVVTECARGPADRLLDAAPVLGCRADYGRHRENDRHRSSSATAVSLSRYGAAGPLSPPAAPLGAWPPPDAEPPLRAPAAPSPMPAAISTAPAAI